MKTNPLYIFLACCLVPLALAYAALKLEWLPTGSSNYGHFLDREVRLDNWQKTEHKQWTIALNYPADCSLACEQQLAALSNLYIAVGKNQHKVAVAVLAEQPKDAAPWQQLAVSKQLQGGDLYLVDHHGLVVLRYPFSADPQQNRLVQKGLLKDLKKLLNYARSS
ncbi:transmembrane cytochrome oxidase associated protein [Pseudoalteromonas mariniglutinosa]|uniref:transmembrane cytochrome oxidase associated protein n=1 Tax=Pseudoalteromonas mariniglutinosa TaxID=206042 RepID=UPI00384E42DB